MDSRAGRILSDRCGCHKESRIKLSVHSGAENYKVRIDMIIA
jgi:hypothetical protein